jgi:hypothetical protein
VSSEFDVRLSYPYMLGVYTAANAIPDALVGIDGRSCAVPKAQQIHGNHDWRSTLLASDGQHRILHTNVERREVWRDRREAIRVMIREGLARPDVSVMFLGAQRMASIGEPPYAELVDELQGTAGKNIVLLPIRSDGDWLTGYEDALAGLARRLPLDTDGGVPRSGVALCGYLWDRNEDDHHGNMRELERLLAGLGVKVVSAWLDGRPTRSLAAVGRARFIISLPYAREAARVLAERTGAGLLETDLPLGLDGTTRWLRQIAAALGVQPRMTEALIDNELGAAAPRLEWAVPLAFLRRAFGFMGDPHLMRAFIGMAHELGARVPLRVIWTIDRPAHEDLRRDDLDDPTVVVDPREGELAARLGPALGPAGVDLVVGNSRALLDVPPEIATVELGFPSFDAHALTDRPFLGYRGCLCLVERIAEQRRLHELLVARLRRHGVPLGPAGDPVA